MILVRRTGFFGWVAIVKRFSLERIVAALAPSLDVALASGEADAVHVVVGPSDWLQISNTALLNRIDPEKEDETATTSTDDLLRTITDPAGMVFGRAKISTNYSYWNPTSGWLTVSGLRANQLTHVDGILTGEAITASRDLAFPTVPKEVLVNWATEQANLIFDARLEDEAKAKAAEVVLECGGDIGRLPIVRWAESWLNTEQLAENVAHENEVIVHFDGDFSYDEDEDSMHPRDFRSYFEISNKIIIVPKFGGSIVSSRGFNWPNIHPERKQLRRSVLPSRSPASPPLD
jgi:hypothetical protein